MNSLIKKFLHVYIKTYNTTIQYCCFVSTNHRVVSIYGNKKACRLSLFATFPSNQYSSIVTQILLTSVSTYDIAGVETKRKLRGISGQQVTNPEVFEFLRSYPHISVRTRPSFKITIFYIICTCGL